MSAKAHQPEIHQIAFLEVLRVVACLLVVYCHLIGYRAQSNWFVKPYIEQFIISPLGIMWNFGFLGVAIFFIVSGFIITHVAQRESRASFAVKRLFRIYPAFFAVFAVTVLLAHVFGQEQARLSPIDLLREASLFGAQFRVIGPSWTLVVELMFYLLVFLILPLLRTRPVTATIIVAVTPVLAELIFHEVVVASQINQLVVLLRYQNLLSIFAVGMAIYYGWTKRLPTLVVVALCGVAWCALILTTTREPSGQSFELNTAYAVIVFLAVLWARPRLGSRSGITAIAAASYSLYLLHAPIAALVIDQLAPRIGYSASLLLSVSLTAVACWGAYRWVEAPSQRAGRWLIRRVGFARSSLAST